MESSTPLTHFTKPRAKFDFITLGIPTALDKKGAKAIDDAIKGRIEVPKRTSGNWFTIHDPTMSDLQYLLDHHPEAEILRLEIAVDFKLADGTNDKLRLIDLHRWLAIRLFPQKHKFMKKAKRKRYDLQSRKILPDNMTTKSGAQTVYWSNANQFEQVRLYIKDEDNKKPIANHTVRTEITLSRGGCQSMGISHVSRLPDFANIMRRELSQVFYVTAGIKPNLKRTRTNNPQRATAAAHAANNEIQRVRRNWNKFGAVWAAEYGYKTIPDTPTNRLIGSALKGLRDDMLRLKLTRKVAELPSYSILKTREDSEVSPPSTHEL